MKEKKRNQSNNLEDLSVTKLFKQMEYQKQHLKFLQYNDMCTSEEKAEIMGMVKDIYKVITSSSITSNKKVSS